MTTLHVVYNAFSGEFPSSWLKNFDVLWAYKNRFSGEYPDLGDENFRWLEKFSQQIGYGMDVTGRPFKAYWPYDKTKDLITGKTIPFRDILKSNKYTVMIMWSTWCPFSKELMPQLLKFYKKYHKDGLEIIANCEPLGHTDAPDAATTILEQGYDAWYNIDKEDMRANLPDYSFYNGMFSEEYTPYCGAVLDSDGNVIFSSNECVSDPVERRFGYIASSDLIPFLETLFGPLDEDDNYSSTNFSRDGEVTTIQKATVGKGINIVLMGDGYSDRDMESGLYDKVMKDAADEFFAIEPYKSFRNRFNVYSVKAVSKNEKCGDGYSTALSSSFGNGTYVTGDIDKCYEYAMKVPGINSRENLLVPVIVRTTRGAGTTYMSQSSQSSVAFFSSSDNDPDYYGSTMRHEAGGHGFGFLGDEYATSRSEIPQGEITEYTEAWKDYGWYANIDFTDSPATIKWAKFLNDSRYKSSVGIYLGGATYAYGVYKPTANSMMNENMEYFNAPSREAIYKRIMTLSGEGYTWEKFLEYDAINRTSATSKSATRVPVKNAEGKKTYQGAPPVVLP